MIPLNFLCVEVFDTIFVFFHNLFNHRKITKRIVPVLLNKKFSTENRDIPLLCTSFLPYRKLVRHEKNSPTKNFGTMRQQFFHRKIVIPLTFFCVVFFESSIVFSNTEILPCEKFQYCEAKKFQLKLVTCLSYV